MDSRERSGVVHVLVAFALGWWLGIPGVILAGLVSHGVVFPARLVEGADDVEGPFAVVDDAGTLLGIYERYGAALKPAVIVAPTRSPASE